MKFITINTLKLDLLLQAEVLEQVTIAGTTVYLIDSGFGFVVVTKFKDTVKMLPVAKESANTAFNVVCDII